jgi:phenylalanyl-tRNA synthetase beta chain
VSTFPPVHSDLAVVVQRETPAGEVEAALRRGAGDLLEELELFDVYTGDRVGEAQKSLAYALTFRAPDRTLTRAEVAAAIAAALAAAAADAGAVLRGSGEEAGPHA